MSNGAIDDLHHQFYNVITYGNEDQEIFEVAYGSSTFRVDRDEYWDEDTEVFEDLDLRSSLPTFIGAECQPKGRIVPARFSRISHLNRHDYELTFDFRHIATTLTSQSLFRRVASHDWEWGRTHWAVKRGDGTAIATKLLQDQIYVPDPQIFGMNEWPLPKTDHCAVMMRYEDDFEPVFDAISNACNRERTKALRVKDIKGPGMVIADVFKCIEQSVLVVCDISGQNPNVFYEAGLAHARNIDVIFITQDEGHQPFNIRHNRYIQYSATNEGLRNLSVELREAIRAARS